MELEERQKAALPDPFTPDEQTLYTEYLRSRGYSGEELQYLYYPGIELADGEEAVVAITASSQEYLRRMRGKRLHRFGPVWDGSFCQKSVDVKPRRGVSIEAKIKTCWSDKLEAK